MTSKKAMSIPGLTLVAAFAVAFTLSAATTAAAYHTNFVATYCYYSSSYANFPPSRATAYRVAAYMRQEGYQWGGGCSNNNNVDDSPGDPKGDPNTGGEGPDCSGLVFKAWMLSDATNDAGFWYSSRFRFAHGPYATTHFMTNYYPAFRRISKSSAGFMDALVSSSHMGLVYARNADGTDQIFEAKGESYGTNVWTRAYRGSTAYVATGRNGWYGG